MKKKLLSLTLVFVTLLTFMSGSSFAQEFSENDGMKECELQQAETQAVQDSDVPKDTQGQERENEKEQKVSESEGERFDGDGQSAVNQDKTEIETETESQTADMAKQQTETEPETEVKRNKMEDKNKLICAFKPVDQEADIFFADYMEKGGESYLLSMLPDKVTAVYEDKSTAEIDASWLPELPFGANGAGKYYYKLDMSKYELSGNFNQNSIPQTVLNAVVKKSVSRYGLMFRAAGITGGIYDEQKAVFSHTGNAEPSDYGGYTTQYFSIQFGEKTFAGLCGKASYAAPAAGSYYVHEIPGGTKESDIVKAILLTNPLTGPYPDNTWNTIAGGKFTDKMLWSVHSALSVYWSDDEYGSDWIRVSAIQEMGNYLYDTWIPAHKDIMNSTHAYYLCASSTPHNSDNFGGKCPSGRQDVLFLSDEVTPQNGKVNLKKVSSDPEITDENSCYSLEGAEYGVYTDSACKNSVGTLKTKKDGTSNTLEVQAGIYYVKETKAPTGYLTDTEVYQVTVTAEQTATVNVTDIPGSDMLGIEIEKIDAAGNKNASLAGAQFTIKYYDGYYTKDNLPSEAGRTWVLETKKAEGSPVRYMCMLKDEYKVGGDSFFTSSGKPVLPLGTISIEETKAPTGYTLDGGYLQPSGSSQKINGKYVAQITKVGDLVKLSGGNKFNAGNYGTAVQVDKADSKTGKGLPGAKLRVTDKSGKIVDEWISDGGGHMIKNLIVGAEYTLEEIVVPDGYTTAEPVTFIVKDTQDVQKVMVNDAPTIKKISKVDAKSGKGLPGAKLRVTDAAGKVIDEWVSDGQPHAIERLIVGHTYTLTEVEVPEGYTTANPVKFTVKDTGEVQSVVMKDEQTTIRVNKVDENGKGLVGAKLRVTDASGKKIDEWTSDGKAHEIKKLVVGQTYTLSEIGLPAGYVTANPVKFTVKDTPEVQTVTMKDAVSRIQINKADEKGKGLKGATLRVMDKNNKRVDEWVSDGKAHEIQKLVVGETYTLVEAAVPAGYVTADPVKFTVKDTQEVQTVTMKDIVSRVKINKVNEQGKGLPGATLRVLDKNNKRMDEWVSDGKAHEIQKLVVGETYTLTEVIAPDGYVTADSVKFTVKDTQDVQNITMNDVPTKLEVTKADKESGKYVAGATLAIYPVDEDGRVLEGECFETFLTTDKPYEIQHIAVGKYVLRELTAPFDNGYVTAEDVHFEVKDTPEVQKIEMKDDYTKIDIEKTDIETGKYVPGATLAVYPVDKDGKVLEDECVETFLTADKPYRIERIPTGNYVLRELTAPFDDGYVTSEDMKFEVKDTPEVQKVEMKDDFTKVEIMKVDAESGEAVAGAELAVYKADEDGKAVEEKCIETFLTTKEPHRINHIAVGTYVLRETKAPYEDGYVTAEDVVFEVKDTPVLKTVTMKDDVTKVKFVKSDEQGNTVTGAYLKLTDADGKVIDEWVSEEEPHIIEKLVSGQSYTLEETKAPNGYSKAEPVTFTVMDTPDIQTVQMVDEKLIDAPKTGDNFNPALFGGSALFFAAAVAVILIKQHKRK